MTAGSRNLLRFLKILVHPPSSDHKPKSGPRIYKGLFKLPAASGKTSFYKQMLFLISAPGMPKAEKLKKGNRFQWFKFPNFSAGGAIHKLRVLFSVVLSPPKQTIDLPVKQQPNVFLKSFQNTPKLLSWSELKIQLYTRWRNFTRLLNRSGKAAEGNVPDLSITKALFHLLRKELFLFVASIDSREVLKVLRTCAVVVLAAIVTLEVLLQLTAIFVWTFLDMRPRIVFKTDNTVLLIGDSYTSGKLLASGIRPYPVFVQSQLAGQKENWRVVNYSSESLDTILLHQEMPLLLQQYRPRFIYLMIGTNDLLANIVKAEAQTKAEAPEAPQKVDWLRSRMLFERWWQNRSTDALWDSLLYSPSFLSNRSQGAISDSRFYERQLKTLLARSKESRAFPYGEWFDGSARLSFQQSGVLMENDSQSAFHVEGAVLKRSSGNLQKSMIWQTDGEDLNLTGPDFYDVIFLKKKGFEKAADGIQAAWKDLDVRRLESAERAFLKQSQNHPEDPLTHAGLAEVYFRMGNHQESMRHILWLRSRNESKPGLMTARSLLRSFPFENSSRDTALLSMEVLKRYPYDPWLWSYTASALDLAGQPDLAIVAIDQALILAGTDIPLLHARLLKDKAAVEARGNTRQAFLNLCRSFLLDDDAQAFVRALQANGSYFMRVNIQKSLDAISCPPEKRALIVSLYEGALNEQLVGRTSQFYERLKSIIVMCRQHGTTAVLVTYPFTQANVEEVMEAVSNEMNSPWLNITAPFEILTKEPAGPEQLLKYGMLTESANKRIAEWLTKDITYRTSISP